MAVHSRQLIHSNPVDVSSRMGLYLNSMLVLVFGLEFYGCIMGHLVLAQNIHGEVSG